MLIDTHCHINTMVKSDFDRPLTPAELAAAQTIIDEAAAQHVTKIINVGTSLIESKNCIQLAEKYNNCFASVGIHPNDCKPTWLSDLRAFKPYLQRKQDYKIIAIGECGIDKHYPDYNMVRQQDAFKAQIELALEHNLALIVHTRDAGDETLRCLDDYSKESLRGTIHCFSEDLAFAKHALSMGFVLGIGGTITYPKNNVVRDVVKTVGLDHIILETDAPFLPPQSLRGKQNHPKYIALIAQYLAELLQIGAEEVADKTTKNALKIFQLA